MIYIIEDDESTRSAFGLFIESMGMEYRLFESVKSFLSGYSPDSKDLLLLDLNLPGMSGLDLLRKFSRDKLQIRVIIITAFDDAQSREECLQYGVRAYLRKPVNGSALFDLIKKNMAVN
jgi:FixJ family two-component response regulator